MRTLFFCLLLLLSGALWANPQNSGFRQKLYDFSNTGGYQIKKDIDRDLLLVSQHYSEGEYIHIPEQEWQSLLANQEGKEHYEEFLSYIEALPFEPVFKIYMAMNIAGKEGALSDYKYGFKYSILVGQSPMTARLLKLYLDNEYYRAVDFALGTRIKQRLELNREKRQKARNAKSASSEEMYYRHADRQEDLMHEEIDGAKEVLSELGVNEPGVEQKFRLALLEYSMTEFCDSNCKIDIVKMLLNTGGIHQTPDGFWNQFAAEVDISKATRELFSLQSQLPESLRRAFWNVVIKEPDYYSSKYELNDFISYLPKSLEVSFWNMVLDKIDEDEAKRIFSKYVSLLESNYKSLPSQLSQKLKEKLYDVNEVSYVLNTTHNFQTLDENLLYKDFFENRPRNQKLYSKFKNRIEALSWDEQYDYHTRASWVFADHKKMVDAQISSALLTDKQAQMICKNLFAIDADKLKREISFKALATINMKFRRANCPPVIRLLRKSSDGFYYPSELINFISENPVTKLQEAVRLFESSNHGWSFRGKILPAITENLSRRDQLVFLSYLFTEWENRHIEERESFLTQMNLSLQELVWLIEITEPDYSKSLSKILGSDRLIEDSLDHYTDNQVSTLPPQKYLLVLLGNIFDVIRFPSSHGKIKLDKTKVLKFISLVHSEVGSNIHDRKILKNFAYDVSVLSEEQLDITKSILSSMDTKARASAFRNDDLVNLFIWWPELLQSFPGVKHSMGKPVKLSYTLSELIKRRGSDDIILGLDTLFSVLDWRHGVGTTDYDYIYSDIVQAFEDTPYQSKNPIAVLKYLFERESILFKVIAMDIAIRTQKKLGLATYEALVKEFIAQSETVSEDYRRLELLLEFNASPDFINWAEKNYSKHEHIKTWLNRQPQKIAAQLNSYFYTKDGEAKKMKVLKHKLASWSIPGTDISTATKDVLLRASAIDHWSSDLTDVAKKLHKDFKGAEWLRFLRVEKKAKKSCNDFFASEHRGWRPL